MNPDAWPEGEEYGTPRERTVWTRMETLDFQYLGPHDGPTYHSNRGSPERRSGQLDHVFASRGFSEAIAVRALNTPAEWGASDRCRRVIDVSP
ncbi:MAG: hypothetical protein OXJ54_02670 [Gemmatimonadetes bacterium]|nr:hypothetical protein [Candidatus Palauibacter rhopaloidicola]